MSDPSRSFGAVADAYERARPSYPREAVEWLVGPTPVQVLELGAGTGKLTEVMVELGHSVFATDPDDAMLDVLSAKLPDVRATVGTAEQIPAADGTVDVVIAGQAFHWFDADVALPEIARVLKPGGRIALVWNDYDERIPWVKRFNSIVGRPPSQDRREPAGVLERSGLFSAVVTEDFKHWHRVDRATIRELALSRSNLASKPAEEREAKLAEVLAFYDEFGRGMDGMQLPFATSCYRASVVNRRNASVPIMESRGRTPGTADQLPRVATEPTQPVPRPQGDAMTLIDFR